MVCVDGLSTRKRSSVGVVPINLKGEHLKLAIKMAFATTNNEAEYKPSVARMEVARELGAKNLEVRSDSQAIVGHIRGEYEA